ncbi:MAG: KEOPS complex subunit Cgi121 [Candidatus Nezhaarchaeota archaeon]|nr:KEOPS complex subunit Cgi121 [Candidatus Nezhaarchaeota archaeon]
MKSWAIDVPGAGRLGVAMTGLILPEGVSVEEALIKAKEVKGVMAIQLFDWRKVMGPLHLLQASALAYKAFREGRMLTKSLSIEVMLYAAGEKQIKEAIARLGVRESRIAALCLAPSEEEARRGLSKAMEVLRASEDEGLIEAGLSKVKDVIEAFKISREEIEAVSRQGEDLAKTLTKCVLSRVAELDVEKED